MAKKGGKGGFGQQHGGADSMKSKLVHSPMSSKMVPKGGSRMSKKGY
jgi:hypothetical protein